MFYYTLWHSSYKELFSLGMILFSLDTYVLLDKSECISNASDSGTYHLGWGSMEWYVPVWYLSTIKYIILHRNMYVSLLFQ